MDTTKHRKKTSRGVDWNNAYIVAALHAEGNSLRKLSLSHGYTAGALKNALHTAWPKGEALIAEAIGEKPYDIWPSRYGADKKPLSGHGQRKARGQGRHIDTNAIKRKANVNTVKAARSVDGAGSD